MDEKQQQHNLPSQLAKHTRALRSKFWLNGATMIGPQVSNIYDDESYTVVH